MEEFDIITFTSRLKEWFIESPLFPYYEMIEASQTAYQRSRNQTPSSKHPNRHPTHLKEAARQCLESSTEKMENTVSFDYGNAVLENNYPHYHILENSPVIRKRGNGTLKSKGSEDMYKIKAQRDYERIIWNGKTFTKEYSRNVRGIRNRMSKVSHWTIEDGQGKYVNRDSNSYYNAHYRYIEKILDEDVVYKLCSEFGLTLKRKEDTDLIDEYANQEGVSIEKVLEAFDSFI